MRWCFLGGLVLSLMVWALGLGLTLISIPLLASAGVFQALGQSRTDGIRRPPL